MRGLHETNFEESIVRMSYCSVGTRIASSLLSQNLVLFCPIECRFDQLAEISLFSKNMVRKHFRAPIPHNMTKSPHLSRPPVVLSTQTSIPTSALVDHCCRYFSSPSDRHIALREVSRAVSVMLGDEFPPTDLKVPLTSLADFYGPARVTENLPETAGKRKRHRGKVVSPPLATPQDGSVALDEGVFFAISKGAGLRDSPEPEKPLALESRSPLQSEGTTGNWEGVKAEEKKGRRKWYDSVETEKEEKTGLESPDAADKPEMPQWPSYSQSSESKEFDSDPSGESSMIVNDCPFLSHTSPSFALYGEDTFKQHPSRHTTCEVAPGDGANTRLDSACQSPPLQQRHHLSLKIVYPAELSAAIADEKQSQHDQKLSKLSTQDTDDADFRTAKTPRLLSRTQQSTPHLSSRNSLKSPRTTLKLSRASPTSPLTPLSYQSSPVDQDDAITEEMQRTLKSRKGKRKVKQVPTRLIFPGLGVNTDRDLAGAYGVTPQAVMTGEKKRALHGALKRLPIF